MDFVSFVSPQTGKLIHSITPPLQIETASLGFDLVSALRALPNLSPSPRFLKSPGSQELCRPQIRFIVVLCYPSFQKVHKLLCYLSVACSQSLDRFAVQFSRCSFWSQDQIEMLELLLKHFDLSLVEVTGLEPVTPCLQSKCSTS